MKVLINPRIQLNDPKKKTSYIYIVVLCKKNLNQLTIKRQTKAGRDKRIIGSIERDGSVNVKTRYLTGYFNANKKGGGKSRQIEMTLDLIFGPGRDKTPVLDINGNVQFKK